MIKKKSKSKLNKKKIVNKLITNKSLTVKKKSISNEFVDILMDIFDKDEKLVSFYISWVKHEGNSTKAYKELHPSVSDQVASVLGARRLAKVRERGGTGMLLCDFGLGIEIYLKKIRDGLNATNIDVINLRVGRGEDAKIIYEKVETPNHAVQKAYHDKLGKLLGLEDNSPGVAVQVNNTNNTNLIDNINDDDLDKLIS